MKIEKINDNQIRCTLTREDLSSRDLKLSELAYGTDKAKSLFRDMMQQAAYECGFEANDIPLMIEAIPISADSIILIITKVEDPEELDTRFAKFAPSQPGEELPGSSAAPPKPEGADDILGLFNKIREAKKSEALAKSTKTESQPEEEEEADISADEASFNLTKLYAFPDLDCVIRASHVLGPVYHGMNSLYKNPATREYHLIISKSDHTPEEFNKVCNILSEYGSSIKYTPATQAFYREHMECLVEYAALQKLSDV